MIGILIVFSNRRSSDEKEIEPALSGSREEVGEYEDPSTRPRSRAPVVPTGEALPPTFGSVNEELGSGPLWRRYRALLTSGTSAMSDS